MKQEQIMKKIILGVCAAALVLSAVGCTKNQKTLAGAGVGGAVGAGAGYALGGPGGAVIGGVAGAAGGALIGHNS
jgi:hypothetical protein